MPLLREEATVPLKIHRPPLAGADRGNRPALQAEQRFQLTAPVENSAIPIGRLPGANSVLLYQIDGPSFRDRVRARQASDLPPILVSSQLIRVESGKVLYHRVVVGRWTDRRQRTGRKAWNSHCLSRDTLEWGITQTVAELKCSFG